jgi:hypothetical protein
MHEKIVSALEKIKARYMLMSKEALLEHARKSHGSDLSLLMSSLIKPYECNLYYSESLTGSVLSGFHCFSRQCVDSGYKYIPQQHRWIDAGSISRTQIDFEDEIPTWAKAA